METTESAIQLFALSGRRHCSRHRGRVSAWTRSVQEIRLGSSRWRRRRRRLQNLLVAIQPAGRDPPLLRQLSLLDAGFPVADGACGGFCGLLKVLLQPLAGGDDLVWVSGVAAGGDHVSGLVGAGGVGRDGGW